MSFRTLIFRSLRFHWRSHLGVVLGATIGSAALIGALVIGDSVRGSLRDSALNRLGNTDVAMDAKDRFVRQELAAEFTNGVTAPVLRLRGSANRTDGEARANQVQVLGIEEHFRALSSDEAQASSQGGWAGQFSGDVAVLNSALARHLNVNVGDTILLRIGKPTALASEAAISPKDDASTVMRLKVVGIWPDSEPLGTFGLQPSPSPPFNAFVPLASIQQQLARLDRVNLLLASGTTLQEAGSRLNESWQLADAELRLTNYTASKTIELRSPRVFLDSPTTQAALAADTNAQPVLTYLVNLLRAGTNTTPYSMVAAAGAPWTAADMRDDEIIVSQWLADDLQVKPGDEIALTYFDPESGGRLAERTNAFRLRAIVPMEMPWVDRTLMPDFPGIEKAESTSDWDAGFPLVHKIRQKDEDYWRQRRGTPKAFITLAAGQKMWANRFGNLTAIRFLIPTNSAGDEVMSLNSQQTGSETPYVVSYKATLAKKIRANLKPEELGLRFEPVREQALNAAEQSQDFGGLFLGFSFFLIIAALLLMAMLFQFGLEQRMAEVGTLLALGFTSKQVRRLLLGESVALAFVGGVMGTLGGILYAKTVLYGLTTVWSDAVGGSTLSFHVSAQTLATGLCSSVIVSVATIWLSLRKLVKRPARELLVGEIQGPSSRVRNRGWMVGWAALIVALGTVGWALSEGETADADTFFSAGSLVLIAGLSFLSAWLKSSAGISRARSGQTQVAGDLDSGATLTLSSLGLRGCARRRTRSLSTATMLACGSFLILSIGVFRLDANRDATKPSSGTGGFALIGESTMPVVQDLNSQSGRDFFALNGSDLGGVNFVPFRVQEGDEASCLNLNGAKQPRLLGVKPEMLEGRFTIAKGDGWSALRTDVRQASRLSPSKEPESSETGVTPVLHGEIPAIGDANSIQWAMHKKVGDTIDYVDERGQPFKVRIVGAVANSILQGQLIIDEAEFVKRFPSASGYRTFLIDAPSNSVAQVSATLSRALQDVGLDLTPAADRLAQFNAVQNTYLGTFQVLGGLGLLLGSVGLGIVVLRNVLERRGELALLQAVGYTKRTLQRLLLIEHGALLAIGLSIGVLAAVVAVFPSVLSPGAQLPYLSLALTLALVLANGALWTWVAARVALRGNLLAALRNE